MSKLSENLKAYSTGARYAKPPKLDSVSFKSNSYELPSYCMEYTLECNITTKFFVKAGAFDAQATNEIKYATDKAKRQILEEIFGEFRQDLYNLDVALYNQDYRKARELLDGVMKNMFDY